MGDARFDEIVDFLASQQFAGNRFANREAGDLAQAGEHAVDLREEFFTPLRREFVLLRGKRLGDKEGDEGDYADCDSCPVGDLAGTACRAPTLRPRGLHPRLCSSVVNPT